VACRLLEKSWRQPALNFGTDLGIATIIAAAIVSEEASPKATAVVLLLHQSQRRSAEVDVRAVAVRTGAVAQHERLPPAEARRYLASGGACAPPITLPAH